MITSGSGIERFVNCRASNVLHRTYDELGNDSATRGTEIHAYLQRIAEGMSAEASLEMVDEKHRPAAAEVELEDLKDILGLTAEITLAYNPVTDTARVLGVALDREYEAAGLELDEIPVTVDVAGLDSTTGPRRGIVVDYKTGFGKITPAAKNWQMRGAALALARHFDLDEVVAQLIYLREGQPVRRDRAVFTPADFGVFAAQAKIRWNLAQGDRKRYEDAGVVPDATRGTWCKYCASYYACPANVDLLRAVVGGDVVTTLARSVPLEHEKIAEVYLRIEEIEEPFKMLKRAVKAAARERPVLIRKHDDGVQEWLGVTESIGNEKLDADVVRTVVKEMLGPDHVDKVSKYSVTKELLEDACKAVAPPRKGAEKMRALMTEVRKRRGAHKPIKHDVEIYKLRPAQLPAAKTG